MKSKLFLLIAFFISMAIGASAQRTSDIDGAKDYPLVSRFDGSVIEYYKQVKWDTYKLPVYLDNTKKPNYKEPLELEGKIQRWQYSVSPDNNPAYVIRNFQKAFEAKGYKILLNAKPGVDFDEGGAGFGGDFYGGFENLHLDRFGFAYEPVGNNTAVIIAKTRSGGNDVYIVEVASAFSNTTLITQDVIEVEAAETGKVTVKSLEDGLSSQGHVAVYDIHFDTGKSDIKPESKDALSQIASYLKANPNKHFAIVGHTDNEGDFQANMKLSQDRATAVMNVLVNDYGVSADQIKAYGVGSLSPVSTNHTDNGRAQNRRVEIVEL